MNSFFVQREKTRISRVARFPFASPLFTTIASMSLFGQSRSRVSVVAWTTRRMYGHSASPFSHAPRRQAPGSAPSSSSIRGSVGSVRWYTPMTFEEQEKEKARVHHLSPEAKENELRQLNREISRLEMLRGINTGEISTWSGRYKTLMRDYGLPLFVYYWVVWTSMGAVTYLAIDLGGLDAMNVISYVDNFTGFNLSSKVDPQLGKIGLALVVNEMMEPIRLPLVVATLKPVMDTINPPKF